VNRNFEVGQRVKVTKAPKEAPHLLGKTGKVVYAWKTVARVSVGDAFTDFSVGEVELLTEKPSL
jgi:predicted RNA-binding protein YlqC (UPF0109 family)